MGFFLKFCHASILKISKCFYFNLIISVCYFPTGISNYVIIIDKEKDKTGDLRKLSTQNVITVIFLLLLM